MTFTNNTRASSRERTSTKDTRTSSRERTSTRNTRTSSRERTRNTSINPEKKTPTRARGSGKIPTKISNQDQTLERKRRDKLRICEIHEANSAHRNMTQMRTCASFYSETGAPNKSPFNVGPLSLHVKLGRPISLG